MGIKSKPSTILVRMPKLDFISGEWFKIGFDVDNSTSKRKLKRIHVRLHQDMEILDSANLITKTFKERFVYSETIFQGVEAQTQRLF